MKLIKVAAVLCFSSISFAMQQEIELTPQTIINISQHEDLISIAQENISKFKKYKECEKEKLNLILEKKRAQQTILDEKIKKEEEINNLSMFIELALDDRKISHETIKTIIDDSNYQINGKYVHYLNTLEKNYHEEEVYPEELAQALEHFKSESQKRIQERDGAILCMSLGLCTAGTLVAGGAIVGIGGLGYLCSLDTKVCVEVATLILDIISIFK